MKAPYSSVTGRVTASPADRKLLRCEIEAVLDRGGFDVVNLAWLSNLKKQAAIEECTPSHIERPRAKGLSLNAASIRGKLFHQKPENSINAAQRRCGFKLPNIVRNHETFHANNAARMDLDLLRGWDLEDALELRNVDGEFEFKRSLGVSIGVMELLDFEDISHRDLTPRDIFPRCEKRSQRFIKEQTA
jgi:hypothetical protein